MVVLYQQFQTMAVLRRPETTGRVTVATMRDFMITSPNGNIFRVTGPLCGEFTGHRWIPHTKASDAEPCCFSLICALNKRLSKQSWGWWFETPSRSLWRHCNDFEELCPSHPNISHSIETKCRHINEIFTIVWNGIWQFHHFFSFPCTDLVPSSLRQNDVTTLFSRNIQFLLGGKIWITIVLLIN